MDTKTANWWDPRASEYLGTAIGGFGLGLGARGIRHLLDLRKKRDLPPEVPAIPSSTTPIPIEVSPEEAQQLEQTGVKVKQAAAFMDNVVRGAMFVPAAYAGWSMLDTHLANKRKALAQQKIDVARARLQGLMSSQPLPEDQTLHQGMKTAEAYYFGDKTAGLGDWLAGGASDTVSGMANSMPSLVPYALGGSMSLLGLSAYNRTQNENKHHKAVSALKNYLERQPAIPSEAELEPVVHVRKPLAGPGHVQTPELQKAAAVDQPETNAPTVKRMKTPTLDTNKVTKLTKKLDAIPPAK